MFFNFQVLGGIDGKRVLVTLGQGSVFGEIALLGVGGMNRRTADVVSRGFSNLFVLQKNDLEMVLKDYEDAKRILNTRARKLMKENEERVAMEFKEHQQYLLEQELKGRQPITDVSYVHSKVCQPFLFTISNVICLVNPQNGSWFYYIEVRYIEV